VVIGDLSIGNGSDGAWFSEAQWSGVGLPTPIRKLLDNTRQRELL